MNGRHEFTWKTVIKWQIAVVQPTAQINVRKDSGRRLPRLLRTNETRHNHAFQTTVKDQHKVSESTRVKELNTSQLTQQ